MAEIVIEKWLTWRGSPPHQLLLLLFSGADARR
jgi:hypothetical protein